MTSDRLCSGRIFRENASPLAQALIQVPVGFRIAELHTAPQHRGAQASGAKRRPPCDSVNAGCHAADDLDSCRSQIPRKIFRHLLPVCRELPRAHNRARRTVIDRKPPYVEQEERGIRYHSQTPRIAGICQGDGMNASADHLLVQLVRIPCHGFLHPLFRITPDRFPRVLQSCLKKALPLLRIHVIQDFRKNRFPVHRLIQGPDRTAARTKCVTKPQIIGCHNYLCKIPPSGLSPGAAAGFYCPPKRYPAASARCCS